MILKLSAKIQNNYVYTCKNIIYLRIVVTLSRELLERFRRNYEEENLSQ